MITKEEIDSKSTELSVNVSSVQRDYVLGGYLRDYHPANILANKLILKGGNCFRKAYFEHSRYSNDLDFSIQQSFDLDVFGRGINEACMYAQTQSGVTFSLHENRLGPKRIFW